MFPSFVGVISAIEELMAFGLIEGYAIGGAIAQLVWDEAIPTFDLHVLVLLPNAVAGWPDMLSQIHAWAHSRGYALTHEHIMVAGVPVQFLPTFDDLTHEAVINAKTVDYDGTPVKVVSPEYLCAIWLTPPANSANRLERVAKLRESVQMDEALISDLTDRYELKW